MIRRSRNRECLPVAGRPALPPRSRKMAKNQVRMKLEYHKESVTCHDLGETRPEELAFCKSPEPVLGSHPRGCGNAPTRSVPGDDDDENEAIKPIVVNPYVYNWIHVERLGQSQCSYLQVYQLVESISRAGFCIFEWRGHVPTNELREGGWSS